MRSQRERKPSREEQVRGRKWDIAFNINNFANTSIRPARMRLSSVFSLFEELDRLSPYLPMANSAKAGLREYLKWHALHERSGEDTKVACAEVLQTRTRELFIPYDRRGFLLIAAYSPDMGYAEPAARKIALEGDVEMLEKVISLRYGDIGYLAASLRAELEQKNSPAREFVDLVIEMDNGKLKMLRNDLRVLFGITPH